MDSRSIYYEIFNTFVDGHFNISKVLAVKLEVN